MTVPPVVSIALTLAAEEGVVEEHSTRRSWVEQCALRRENIDVAAQSGCHRDLFVSFNSELGVKSKSKLLKWWGAGS